MTRTRKSKAPSDSTLQTLWRKVVRSEWGNRCAFAYDIWEPELTVTVTSTVGGAECEGYLECHHIKRRRIPHLRHCPTNGVLICQKHHGKMKYRIWQERLEVKLGDKVDWLDAEEMKLFPAFLAERGQTRAEYLQAQKAYLTALLNGSGE